MLEVLLVDNDPSITKGLTLLVDWETAGFTIAGTAANGQQALRFLQKHPVDLIIADIQMPVMSGLDLLEAIQKSKVSDAYFVILSGYSDFEYARQAMQFGCDAYLLKPIMPQELTELLQKVQKYRQRTDEDKARNAVYSAAYFSQCLLALLHNTYDEATITYISDRIPQSGGIRYVGVDLCLEEAGTITEKQRRKFQSELFESCMQALGSDWSQFCLKNMEGEKNRCSIGFIFFQKMARELGLNDRDFLLALRRTIQKSLPIEIIMFVGEQVGQMSDLPASYRSALQVQAMQGYCAQAGEVLFYQPPLLADTACIEPAVLDAFLEAVNKNDTCGISTAVDAMQNKIKSIFDPDLLQMDIDYLLYQLTRMACERDNSLDRKEVLRRLKEELRRNGRHQESWDYLVEFASKYAEYLASMGQEDSRGILVSVEREIRLNYSENLTLKEIGQKYYINSAYLGQLFKKKYGLSFKEYLNQYRIEQAARFLVTTNEKIYNIARKVGYQNMDYFLERFITAKGCTPSSYRKQNKK